MEPWFLESQAFNVSCNYELYIFISVMMNPDKLNDPPETEDCLEDCSDYARDSVFSEINLLDYADLDEG